MGCLTQCCTTLISHKEPEVVNKVPIGLLINRTSLEKILQSFQLESYVQVAK